MLEKDLLIKFTEKGCSFKPSDSNKYFCLTEIQIGNKIPDIVFVDEGLNIIIAIELKINKWKDALKQALTYQLWAQKSYIALPFEFVQNALNNKEIFQRYGIGIISIQDACEIKLEAEFSKYLIETYISLAKQTILDKINKGEYCQNGI